MMKREGIFERLSNPRRSTTALILGHYLNLLVIASMVLFCLELYPTMVYQKPHLQPIWFWMECFFAANFTLDLLAKLATAPGPGAYLLTQNILIDLCSIIPWIYQFLWNSPTHLASQIRLHTEWAPLGLLMTLRLLRFFRFLADTMDDADIFSMAFRRSKIAFNFIFVYIFAASLFFGTAIYYAETRPCKFDRKLVVWLDGTGAACAVQNLFDGIWFSVVTMFTVGYGDIYPKTKPGKAVAVLLMVCSCVVFGLSLAVYGSNLTELYLERREARRKRKSSNDDTVHGKTIPSDDHNDRQQPIISTAEIGGGELDPHVPRYMAGQGQGDGEFRGHPQPTVLNSNNSYPSPHILVKMNNNNNKMLLHKKLF